MCKDNGINNNLIDDASDIMSDNEVILAEENDRSNNELVVDLFPLPGEEEPGDNTIIGLPALILDTLVSDEDLDHIDSWHNVFPEIALTRNPELSEKYGLEVGGGQENKKQHFPSVDFALGGIPFKANPVVRMATYENLSHAKIPDFASQLHNALSTIQATPEEELAKIKSIEVDMEVFVVPGKLKVKKLKLK